MSPQSTPSSRPLQELDECLAHIVSLQSEIDTVTAPARAAMARAQELAEQAATEIEPLLKDIERERQAVADTMRKNRRSLLRHVRKTKAGKIIDLPHGELMMKVVAKSVELPPDIDGLVRRLLKMRGGKRYLEVKYVPNKKALHAANSRLRKRLGVKVGRFELYYAQASGEEKRTEVGRRRYPDVG